VRQLLSVRAQRGFGDEGAGQLLSNRLSTATDVLVIVVTYNSEDVIGDLLSSLPDALAGRTWELVVVDNDSRDGTVAAVRSAIPQSSIVEMGRNAGYAAGINAGLSAGGRAASVLILNPDTRLDAASVVKMLRRLRESGAGIVVPRLLDSQRRLVHTLRREPSVRRAIGDAVLTAKRAGRFPGWGEFVTDAHSYDHETSADWAAGTVMLISRECLEACGGWDESFFLYSEETEFCLRARDHGFKLVLSPDAEVVHLGGESEVSPSLRTLLVVNRIVLYRRSHTVAASTMFWLVAVLRELSRLALGRASRRTLLALINPRHARAAGPKAALRLPDLERRRMLARAADSTSVSTKS
jgi:GT2 family glycosyltransferase